MPKLIENARQTLIIEGRKLLLEKSYSDFNIREIAKNCAMGTGTFYNYFKTKDELVSAIFQDDWHKILNIIDALLHEPIPLKEKFRTIYNSMAEFLDRYISIFYEISMVNNKRKCPEDTHGFDILYLRAEELIEIEKKHSQLDSQLTSKELATLVMSNLIYLCKTRYTSFDKLYDSLLI